MSAVDIECGTSVSVNGCSDYLPRVRKIVACMADSVGMNTQESATAEMILSELCSDAGAQGSGQAFSFTLTALDDGIVADLPVRDDIAPHEECIVPYSSVCDRLRRLLADGVQFVRHHTGFRVKLTKRASEAKRVETRHFSAHHRN